MDGIKEIADSFGAELKHRLPKQRKTQRTKLALLVATMLDVRSANLMELAAGLPREADRHALPVDHASARQPLGDQRRDHGAILAGSPGAGGRRRPADRPDPGPIQGVGPPSGADDRATLR